MTSKHQHIRQLYLENLTGTISAEDYERLNISLETDENFRTIWRQLEEEGRQLRIYSHLEEIEPENELMFIRDKIESNNTKFIWKPLTWAATLVFAVGLSWYFLPDRDVKLFTRIDKGKNLNEQKSGIRLTTPDGRAVSLTAGGTQSLELEGIQLDNKNGILTYSGDTKEAAWSELYVPVQEDYEIILSDGTKVSLNSDTKLKFPFHFAGSTREVFVEGEAFFEVAKDSQHPFIVHTGLADVVVTGTSFNINTYDAKQVKTALVEGKVQVKSSGKRPLDLLPGFEATASSDQQFTTSRFDVDEVLAWRSGQYFFHNQPLEALSSFIMRWYDVEVIFDKSELRSHTVSGLLERRNLNEFLVDLKTTTGIDHRFDGRKLHLK